MHWYYKFFNYILQSIYHMYYLFLNIIKIDLFYEKIREPIKDERV